MYRVTTLLSNARIILHRRNPLEVYAAALSRASVLQKYGKAKERDPCPPDPCPPPIPPPKDDRLLWGTIAAILLAGGFATYAKTNNELRDWLTIYAPWFDDVIAVMFQENMTYGEFAQQCVEDVKKKFADSNKPKPCALDEETGRMKPVIVIPEEPKAIKVDKDNPCDVLPLPSLTPEVCEVEKCLKDVSETVINNYWTAKEACNYYNNLVDDAMSNFTLEKMKALAAAKAERQNLVKDSVDKAECATLHLNELDKYFECGIKGPKEEVETAQSMLDEARRKIKRNLIEFQWMNDKSLAWDQQYELVEIAVNKYIEENQTMFPGLKYDIKKPSLPGDPDLMLYHTFRYTNQMKSELKDSSQNMSERICRAYASLGGDEKAVKQRESLLQQAVAKKRAEMEADFKKKFTDQKAANDKQLKDSLAMQLQRHQELLQTRLAEKEVEANKKLEIMVRNKVAAEKKEFGKQLREMAIKLGIVEEKLNARLKAEREVRRSQQLYAAGSSLLAATKKKGDFVTVDKEIKAIENAAGDGDKLVATVLKAIPDSVRTKGVASESALRRKYHTMEKTALAVALVETEGAPLPVFILSYVQSLLLFMKLPSIPPDEVDKPPKEPPTYLDTFDLLQRARFWVERGNLNLALRYVNALSGASLVAAQSWQEAVRSHCETRQAAEALLAHAAALGLQYV